MNVYVWERLMNCTTNYHSEGGIVVFADSEDEARQLAGSEEGRDHKFYPRIAPDEAPDEVRACADGPKLVFIMPNAGCC